MEQRLGGLVARFDEGCEHLDSCGSEPALADPDEPDGNPTPPVLGAYGKAVNPALPPIVRPEDGPDEPFPVEGPEIQTPEGSKLAADRVAAVATADPRVQAADAEEFDENRVVADPEGADSDPQGQSSRVTR